MGNERIKSLRDLIIAILISDSEIKNTNSNGKQIFFTLEQRKQYILENYISRNHLENSVSIKQIDNTHFIMKNNLILESIVQDWTGGKQQIVQYVNPQLLNTNVFILLICLFGKRGKKDVVIKTNLARKAQETLQYVVYELIGINCIPTNKHFKIRLLNKLVAKSIMEGRPAYESMEMMLLLTEPEKKIFLNVSNYEGDHLSYAVY